jgi:hypothetical protein
LVFIRSFLPVVQAKACPVWTTGAAQIRKILDHA